MAAGTELFEVDIWTRVSFMQNELTRARYCDHGAPSILTCAICISRAFRAHECFRSRDINLRLAPFLAAVACSHGESGGHGDVHCDECRSDAISAWARRATADIDLSNSTTEKIVFEQFQKCYVALDWLDCMECAHSDDLDPKDCKSCRLTAENAMVALIRNVKPDVVQNILTHECKTGGCSHGKGPNPFNCRNCRQTARIRVRRSTPRGPTKTGRTAAGSAALVALAHARVACVHGTMATEAGPCSECDNLLHVRLRRIVKKRKPDQKDQYLELDDLDEQERRGLFAPIKARRGRSILRVDGLATATNYSPTSLPSSTQSSGNTTPRWGSVWIPHQVQYD